MKPPPLACAGGGDFEQVGIGNLLCLGEDHWPARTNAPVFNRSGQPVFLSNENFLEQVACQL